MSKEGINFNYRPGQYLELFLKDVKDDPEGYSRSFSIASSPTENFIMIATRITETPFKQRISRLKIGEKVEIDGPFGNFVLKEDSNKVHVMLSGGIGITALRNMIKYATDKKLPLKIILMYSNGVPEDIVFREELEKFQKKNENLKIVHTITRPEESKTEWNGITGRIDAKMIRKFVPDLENAEFYVVGPPAMVDSMVEILKSMKIPEGKINIEHYVGY